jgi:hypothetical protein
MVSVWLPRIVESLSGLRRMRRKMRRMIVVTQMKFFFGLDDKILLELILLGLHQTSWLRFFFIGMKMERHHKMEQPFQTYIKLAEENFGSITGGPKPWADPPGIDMKAIYYTNDFAMKHKVVECIMMLLGWVNVCLNESFNCDSLRKQVLETSKAILAFKAGAELGNICLMPILQICALSLVVLIPSPKLLNLLYPKPGKGSANHLCDLNIDVADHHQDALTCVLHRFDLNNFGANAGESILCETLPGQKVFDAFFTRQSLFLMNALGKLMRKEYLSQTWKTVDDDDSNIV